MVTVRDRDTMEQKRIPISELVAFIQEKIEFNLKEKPCNLECEKVRKLHFFLDTCIKYLL